MDGCPMKLSPQDKLKEIESVCGQAPILKGFGYNVSPDDVNWLIERVKQLERELTLIRKQVNILTVRALVDVALTTDPHRPRK